MQHRRTGTGLEQQVFCPTPQRLNDLARQDPLDIRGHRPAQSTVANDHTTNLLVQDPWSDSAAACFDFGEFRHLDDQL
jgi:hypothetical protein